MTALGCRDGPQGWAAPAKDGDRLNKFFGKDIVPAHFESQNSSPMTGAV